MKIKRLVMWIVVMALLFANVVLPQRKVNAAMTMSIQKMKEDSAIYTKLAKGQLKLKVRKKLEVGWVTKLTIENRQKAK